MAVSGLAVYPHADANKPTDPVATIADKFGGVGSQRAPTPRMELGTTDAVNMAGDGGEGGDDALDNNNLVLVVCVAG